jgi:hypothetical protein
VVVDDPEGQHVARSARPAAWVTLAIYWGSVVASCLLRVLNDPTTDVGGAVLQRLGWGAYPTVGQAGQQ